MLSHLDDRGKPAATQPLFFFFADDFSVG